MNFKESAENLGLEEDEYLELIDLFVEVGETDLDKLQSGIDDENAEEVAKAAHSLKGASGNLGLMEFSRIAKEIEEKGQNNQLEGTDEATQALRERLKAIAEFSRSA
ncbi:MAG: Hpt domain-containing protein [Thermodesulfobacteriota bacterium]|nr:Hpt domain-containing protein [Thermodesulfobacteriota bacterium]